MRDDVGVTGALGHLDRGKGFRQRADLVDLDEHGVGNTAADAFANDLRVGHEDVIADDLRGLAELVSQQLPAIPIAFGHAVFDTDDRVLAGQRRQVIGEAGRSQFQLFRGEDVLAVLVELGGGAVQAQHHILARRVAGGLNRFQDQFDRFVVACHIGREATFVADRGRIALLVHQLLQVLENFGATA